MIWLGAVVVVGVVVAVAVSVLWGLVAGVATLVVSDVVERVRRRRRALATGSQVPSIRDVFSRRKSSR